MQHKIGAYIRVSTEEQAQVVEGSLDNQKHRISGYIDIKNMQDKDWGKAIEFYVDDGYSAKDTKRPAYQRMMRDIKKGKINLILVTDLSRLSRNILDFCNLLKDLEMFKSKFLSIKEQFDTSTPAGEMMIYNMVNLAQFERKQTSERVSLGCHSRSMRGLMNGGPSILGYDKNPENTGTYLINKEEAEQVNQIFQIFLEQGTLSKTIKEIETLGFKPKSNPRKKNRLVNSGWWSSESLSVLLQRKAYIGLKEVNKIQKSKDQETLKPWQRYTVVKASWPPIVDKNTFDQVQNILEENRKLERARLEGAERRVFFFSSLTFCPECGRAMTGQSAHGEKVVHRYYAHVQNRGETVSCKIKRISADDLEQTVISHLGRILHRAGYFEGIEKNIQVSYATNGDQVEGQIKLVEKALREVELEFRGALKVQGGTNSTSESFKLVVDSMEQLAERKNDLTLRLDNLKDQSADDYGLTQSLDGLRDRLQEFNRGWSKMTVAQKKRLLRRTIKRLEVHPDMVGINFYLADGRMGFMPIESDPTANCISKNGGYENNVIPFKNKKPTDSNLSVPCSRVVNNGDLAPTRTGMSSLGNYHSILLNYEVIEVAT